MSVLTVEELFKLPMLICKICNRRLQCPVMQMGMFGNICGVCNERSVLTDVIINKDVEMLLSKMHVSCNYKGRGCTYDGPYYKTCEHEKDCKFRDKICPFAYLGICDNIPGDFHDIPAHISSHHEENVLLGEMNRPVQVPNPSETNRDIFYLLRLDDKEFLLRTWIDRKEECIFYALYYFKNNIELKNINISFQLRWKSAMFNVTDQTLLVQDESGIKSGYETHNVFSIPIDTLKSLNCLENVAISIHAKEEALIVTAQSRNRNFYSPRRPRRPSRRTVTQYTCREIYIQTYIHCRVIACAWRGTINSMAYHMSDTHSTLINVNVSSLQTTGINFFVKGVNVFEQTLELVNYRELSIKTKKLTEPYWDDSYKWEIRVERKDKPMMMVITDLCTEAGSEKCINVESFVDSNVLTLYADIKSLDEYALSEE